MRHVLIHGASIGELLAAEPVLAGLRAAVPALHATYSYTSSSVRGWPAWPADHVERIPVPTAAVMGRWLNRLRPDLLVLSRGDLWPGMLWAARRRSIPVAVIGGRIRPDSRRLRWPVREFLARGVRSLAHVGVVDDEEALRWIDLGAMPERVRITGDPAVDRALAFRPDPFVVAALRNWAAGEPILVFGSVEPSDREAVLALLAEAPRAVVVPHDPERTRRLRLPGTVRPWVPGTPPPAAAHLVVPTRGHLADCYGAAAAAYIGGWNDARPHSWMEAEARGLLPIVGSVREVVAAWRYVRDRPAEGRRIGRDRRAAVAYNAGAAAREVAAILPLLQRQAFTPG